MRSPIENALRVLVPVVALISLCSCKYWSGGNTPPPNPNAPGSINATLNMHVGGGTSVPCTSSGVAWAASSPSGSPQSKTSPAITASDNVMSQCTTAVLEGTSYTTCYCQSSVVFTSLAPGRWTVQAPGASCPVQVSAGKMTNATLYNDGKPCTTIP